MTRKLIVSLVFTSLLLSCTQETLDSANSVIEDTRNIHQSDSTPLSEIELSHEDLVYDWIGHMQHDNGLMESAEGTDFVSLYDNALASLIFMAKGDFHKAEKIFDHFNDRIDLELLNGTGGFYQFRNTMGENGSRTWLGDNSWLLIALNNYKQLTNNSKYDRLSAALQNWIRSLQVEDGGLVGGFNDDGSAIGKITEGMITAFNAVHGYDDFHRKLLNYLHSERWDESELLLVTQKENPKYQYALDLHSLSYLIFENFPDRSLEQASRYQNNQISTVTVTELEGYCFDEDADVIWLEGTAQMALAYGRANQYLKSDKIIEELEKAFILSELHPDTKGLPYTANQGTTFGAAFLWEHADLKPALSSSIWYLFNKMDFDPLALEGSKSIPENDRFWIPVM